MSYDLKTGVVIADRDIPKASGGPILAGTQFSNDHVELPIPIAARIATGAMTEDDVRVVRERLEAGLRRLDRMIHRPSFPFVSAGERERQ